MNIELFISDSAIVIYEVLIIGILAVIIGKLRKKNKQIISVWEKRMNMEKEQRLQQQLINEKRR